MSDYKNYDAAKLSAQEFDALTTTLRAGRTPVDAEQTLSQSAEAKRVSAEEMAARLETMASEKIVADARIRELEQSLAARGDK